MNANPSGAQTMLGESEYAARLALLKKARAGDPAAIRTLAEKYKVRIGGIVPCVTPRDMVKRGVTMGDMVNCEVCGKQVKAQGLGVHKAKAHGTAGLREGGECPYCHEPKSNPHEHVKHCPQRIANEKPQQKRATPPKPTARNTVTFPLSAVTDIPGNGHCDACLFRGLERHLDQELVAEAVRGGMGLSAAAAFVRRVRETR